MDGIEQSRAGGTRAVGVQVRIPARAAVEAVERLRQFAGRGAEIAHYPNVVAEAHEQGPVARCDRLLDEGFEIVPVLFDELILLCFGSRYVVLIGSDQANSGQCC
jgi:hypothetical protein